MSKDGDNSRNRDLPLSKESEANKSFVRKVKSRVSGFIPSSFTKWFGGNEGPKIRQREELEDEDESFQLQPPTKRAKLPNDVALRDHLELKFVSTPLYNSQAPVNNFSLHTTYDESTPGPSGVKARKLILPKVSTASHHYNGNIDTHNGDKDSDSGESTSGYSSMPRIGSKEQVSEISDKHCTTQTKPPNRSLFNTSAINERSLFANELVAGSQSNSSLSSRRPAFNATSFGSPNFMDRTLSTKRIVNSPFYVGRTTYGGASAYSRNLIKRSPEVNSSLKNFVQPKPVNTLSDRNLPLSKTAKRILDTLEQYTSPSEDVRKIPNPSNKRVQKPEGLISKYTGANPYLIRDSKVPSNKELQVPTMTDLLKMKLKERLQDSTVSVREIAAKSKSILNTEEYKLRTVEEPSNLKSSNKMKTKVTNIRQKQPIEDNVNEVILPEVKLPISTLPTFNFTVPFPKKDLVKLNPINIIDNCIITPKKTNPSSTQTPTSITENKDLQSVDFKFSKPLVITENLKSIRAINNFKFSEPVCKKGLKACDSNNFKIVENAFVPIKRNTIKINSVNGPILAAKELISTGSVMDILERQDSLMVKFKPAEGTWECNMCMLRNLEDKKKCVACECPKSNVTSQPTKKIASSGFGDQFKIASGQWECSVCMIRNDAIKSKCVACETPKVSAQPKKEQNNSFGNTFKLSSDKWECEVCMVRNDGAQSRCVACTAPKPITNGPLVSITPIVSGFGDKFKPSTTSWECSTCFIRNEFDKTKCAACETPKSGTKTNTGFGNLVNKKTNEWECDSCMVKNPLDRTKCQCCESLKPGSIPVPSINLSQDDSIPKFSFGIDKAQLNGNGFTFGVKSDIKRDTSGSVAPSSIFGESANLQPDTCTTFSFGVKPINGAKPSTMDKPVDIKPIENKPETSLLDITFGTPKSTIPMSLKQAAHDGSTTSISLKKPDINSCSPASTTTLLNGVVKNGENSIKTNTDSKTYSFSANSTSTNPTNLFSFGGKSTSANDAGSIFSDKKCEEQSTIFKVNEKPALPHASTMFSTPTNSNNTNVSNSLGLNTPNASFTLPTSKPSFGTAVFGSPSSKESQTFSFNENPKPVQPNVTPTGIFSFGSSKPAESSAATLNMGSSNPPSGGFNLRTNINGGFNNPPTTSSDGFNFSPTPVGGFSFSTTKSDTTTFAANPPPPYGTQNQSTAPTFGSTSSTTNFAASTSNTPSFDLNTNTAFGTTPNPPAFGNAAANPFGTPSPPASTFGSASPFSAPAIDVPSFGSASAQPTQNGIFNFGSAASSTTPKTGFNFGANSAAPSFNFASNQNAPSSGFNFGPSSCTPSFNADVKPTYNFTGTAPNVFSAQLQSGDSKSQPQRVFRKAHRRTQPR